MAVVESWEANKCKMGCGFFGAPWTMGMCSRCYRNRDKIPIALIAEPLRARNGETPPVIWSQRSATVYIRLQLLQVSDLAAGFSDASTLDIQAFSEHRWYELRAMPLFASCVPGRSVMIHRNDEVAFVLVKQKRKWWDKLSINSGLDKFIKRDTANWQDEDDSDYENTSVVSDHEATSEEEDVDDSHPRFSMWQWLKRRESSDSDRPASHVFDVIDGSSSEIASRAMTTDTQIRRDFRDAASKICLTTYWCDHTQMQRYLAEMEMLLHEDSSLRKQLADATYFDELAASLVQHAYQLETAEMARSKATIIQQDEMTLMEIPPSLCRPYNVLKELRDTVKEDGKVRLAYSLQLLLKYEKPDCLVAKLHEVSDRVPRCNSAKKQAFNMLFTHAFRCKEHAEKLAKATSCGSCCATDVTAGDEQIARDHVNRCFADFLDDHKDNAFSSAFVEPSRLYFHSIGDHMSFELVRQHGINWYLVLLHAGLGMKLPFLPDYNDSFEVGLGDFWLGLSPDVWDSFSEPSSFGKEFLGIPTFRGVKFASEQFVRDPSLSSEFPIGVQTGYPRNIARVIADVDSTRCASVCRKLVPYVERFAYFFSRDFFIKRALETLNSEVKPEHAGFRKALGVVYDVFKREKGDAITESTVEEYCYRDEYFTDLDLDKTEQFFSWLGFIKGPKITETCPICCEDKLDVEILDHWQSVGDISSHRMCASCRESYGKNECPFCKEVLIKEEILSFIANFTGNVQRNSQAQRSVESMAEYVAVANQSAQLLEHWQLFEMQHDGNTRLVRRVAKLVVDELSAALVGAAADRCKDWLRDVAGVVFRLHAMISEGEIQVDEQQQKAFVDSVECILEPFERSDPVDFHIGPFEGHFYGHLYNQVLVAWLCAFRANVADSVLRNLVRRVGRGIVRCTLWYEERGSKHGLRGFVAEVMHKEYIALSHEPCWGCRDKDPVWQTFCVPSEDALASI